MADIFISHSGNDSEIAAAIGERIRRERPTWSLFYDKDSIYAGQRWQERLRDELMSCRVVLALLSRNWLGSPWCFTKAVTATFRGKGGKDVVDIETEDLRACRKVYPRPIRKGVGLCRACINATIDRNTTAQNSSSQPKVRSSRPLTRLAYRSGKVCDRTTPRTRSDTVFSVTSFVPASGRVPALEKAISRSKAVAILVGKHGIGDTLLRARAVKIAIQPLP